MRGQPPAEGQAWLQVAARAGSQDHNLTFYAASRPASAAGARQYGRQKCSTAYPLYGLQL
jgi:hypothetical protein